MGNAAKVSTGIIIILGLLTLVFFAVSLPQIEVTMIHSKSTVFGTNNVKIEIDREDSRFGQWSNICFRIDNAGQALGSYEVPASNFKVALKTDAICKGCDIITDFTTLSPQGNVNFCKEIKAPVDSNELNFEVITEYSALLLSPSTSDKFVCELEEESSSKNTYTCNAQK